MAEALDRRIRQARANLARAAMQTSELPFEPPADTAAGDENASLAPGRDALPAQAGGRGRSMQAHLQQDLFAPETPAGHPEAGDDVPAEPDEAVETEAGGTQEPEPEPDAVPATVDETEGSDVADHGPEASARHDMSDRPDDGTKASGARDDDPDPSDPDPATSPGGGEPYLLDPRLILLQKTESRHLRPTDRADQFLYHISSGADAVTALEQGLLVSASDPMILTERQGVAYWLSMLTEDYDYILDGPADFVVLRMRRISIEDLLEPDDRASHDAGCPCYLLTGGRRAGR